MSNNEVERPLVADGSASTADARRDAAVRDEVASLLHSQIRCRVIMLHKTASEAKSPTRVLSAIRSLLSVLDEVHAEVLGLPTTSSSTNLMRAVSRTFAGDIEVDLEPTDDVELSPEDYDLCRDVLFDLITNAAKAGATTSSIWGSVDRSVAPRNIMITVTDNGPGLGFDPWAANTSGHGSSRLLLNRLRRQSGGLRRVPRGVGTQIEASWKLREPV